VSVRVGVGVGVSVGVGVKVAVGVGVSVGVAVGVRVALPRITCAIGIGFSLAKTALATVTGVTPVQSIQIKKKIKAADTQGTGVRLTGRTNINWVDGIDCSTTTGLFIFCCEMSAE
jgi:hypothetical protein